MAFTSWKLGWRLSWSRVAKYKQRRQLKTRPALSGLESIQIGACTGLSLAWITSHKNNPRQKPSDRIESFNSDADFVNHDRIANYFNRHGSSQEDRVAQGAAYAMGTDIAGVVAITENDLTTFANALDHLTEHPGYHMLSIIITNHKTSHVCALYAGANDMIFFDANFGEFKISNPNRGAFFLNLKNQYKNYISAAGEKGTRI